MIGSEPLTQPMTAQTDIDPRNTEHSAPPAEERVRRQHVRRAVEDLMLERKQHRDEQLL